MKSRLGLWIGLSFCLFSAGCFLIDSWPAERRVSQFEVAPRGFLEPLDPTQTVPLAGSDGMLELPASYTVSLDLPANLRVGKAEPLHLTIQQKGTAVGSSPLSGWQVSIEGSLTSPDLRFRPEGSIYERLEPDDPASFVWFLTGVESSTQAGTLWLYLLFHSPQGGEPARVLVLARPLAFAIVKPLGISGAVFQSVGWVGLVVGAGLLLWASLPGWIRRRRNA